MFRLRRFDSIAASENSAARLRRFARSCYRLRCAGIVCPNAAARGIAFSERISARHCRLRSALGHKDSDAGQSRTERNPVFAKDKRWDFLKDAGDFHPDAVHLRHVPRASRLLRFTRLWVRTCRCSRPREFWRRVRTVRTRAARRPRCRRVARATTILRRQSGDVGRFLRRLRYQWATTKELPPHLTTIVPVAAAHPPLDYPSLDNVGACRF